MPLQKQPARKYPPTREGMEQQAKETGKGAVYSKVTSGAPGAAAAAVIPTPGTPADDPAVPDPAFVDECRHDPAAAPQAGGLGGRVWNRYLMCGAGSFILNGPNNDPLSQFTTNVTAVSLGHNKDRSITGYISLDHLTTVGWFNDNTVIKVRLRCADPQAFPQPACHESPILSRTVAQWRTTPWAKVSVTSPATDSGGAADAVTRFTHGVSVEFPNFGTPSTTRVWRNFFQNARCDSATYFTGYPMACVFMNVNSHLQYSLSAVDPVTGVSEVAAHIQQAQNNPSSTIPARTDGQPKVIPGKYSEPVDPNLALHRAPSDTANRAVSTPACNAAFGSPRPTGKQCDEYPFASTLEGAASTTWDYSIKLVIDKHNTNAGSALSKFYKDDRILRNSDFFYVQINI